MPVEASILEYHRSVSRELRATKNRIRHLLGRNHYQTDGEHKEAILRRALRTYLPGTLRVGRGFICYPGGRSSTQVDVLITDTRYPTLFQDGDTVIVTADAVRAIIEVKTSRRNPAEIGEAVNKLGDDIYDIREAGNRQCQAGLFVYDEHTVSDSAILEKLALRAEGNEQKVVNWIAYGPHRFFRFWKPGQAPANAPVREAVWHSYRLRGLAYSYFLSNVVWETAVQQDLRQQGRYVPRTTEDMWFALEEDGGKENYRKWYVPLVGGGPQEFV